MFVFSSFCIHLSVIMTVRSILPPVALTGIVAHPLLTKVHLFGCRLQPSALLLSPALPPIMLSVLGKCAPSTNRRVNEDICFHSGSAGTRPPLPRLSETISRHLLAADCSGRFLLLLSPSTPPSGLRKVLHRSPRCVANLPARSDLEGEKIDSERKRCRLSDSLFEPDYVPLFEHLI